MAALSLITAGVAAADTAPPGSSGEPYAASRSYLRTSHGVQQIWFVCAPLDGTDQTVVGLPDKASKVRITQPLSAGAASVFKLGRADPGAGQIYWALSDASGKEVGDLHAFNTGVFGDPVVATTPTFLEVRANAAQWSCRWIERTTLLGFSAKRVFEIFSGGGATHYQTFDFKDAGAQKRVKGGVQDTTTPSLDITGGYWINDRLHFENQGYAYDITMTPKDARVEVSKAGRRISNEPLIAWTLGEVP